MMTLLEPQDISHLKTKKAKYFKLYLDVPENMNFLATDSDGSVYGYEYAPRLDGDDFEAITGDWVWIADVELTGSVLWAKTLIKIEWSK